MPYPTTERLLTLHGLRLSGLAAADEIAGRHALDATLVEGLLAAAQDEGLARHRGRPMTGWLLTPEGRVVDARMVAEELAAAGVRPAVEDAYDRIRRLQPTMQRIRADWEWTDTTTYRSNDHADETYDAAVVDRLVAFHQEAIPIWSGLAAVLDRFLTYGPRFDAALTNVQAGRFDWFTQPLIDSYHTVWFELHEDLLVTLGIERSKEDMF
jgi:hypothetical protein